MLERFTGDARRVVTGAREGARLGHDWIGCERLRRSRGTVTGRPADGAVGCPWRPAARPPGRGGGPAAGR